jgi:hypothetical protein
MEMDGRTWVAFQGNLRVRHPDQILQGEAGFQVARACDGSHQRNPDGLRLEVRKRWFCCSCVCEGSPTAEEAQKSWKEEKSCKAGGDQEGFKDAKTVKVQRVAQPQSAERQRS